MTYTFGQGIQKVGFGSELTMFYLSALIARYTGRTMLVNGTDWNYGDYDRIFESEGLGSCPNVKIDRRYDEKEFVLPSQTDKHVERVRGKWEGQISWFQSVNRSALPFSVYRDTVQHLYRPSMEVADRIDRYLQEIPQVRDGQDYYAIHVRRGDKVFIEAKTHTVAEYLTLLEATIKKVERRNVTKDTDGINLFVASDDIDAVYPEVVKLRPKWHVFRTSEFVSRSGHFQLNFNGRTMDQRFTETAFLMAELEIMKYANIIICTLSSNICTLVQLLRTQPVNTLDSLDSEFYGDISWMWPELDKQK
eukprot:gene17731-21141_t